MASQWNKNKFVLPIVHGGHAIDIGCNSVYFRWILAQSNLSEDEIHSLCFEFATTDNSLKCECSMKHITSFKQEYKVRINGLDSNTKYQFHSYAYAHLSAIYFTHLYIVRCKLTNHHKTIYSKWSQRIIEFRTKPQKISIMTDHYRFLQNELTKLQTQNEKLQLEIQSLRPVHLNWNYSECIEWILRINDGIFKRYEHTLNDTFKQQQINGSNLYKLDISALHNLGITNFAHKKILISHIHKLTQNDQLPDLVYDHRSAQTIKSPKNEFIEIEHNESADDETETIPLQDDHYDLPSPQQTAQKKKKSHRKLYKTSLKIEDEKNDFSKYAKSSPLIDTDTPAMSNINSSNDYGLSQSQKALLCGNASNEPLKTWKYKDGMLSVLVVKAINVDNMDEDEGPDSASDPYVELELKGHYKREQTKVIQNNANPEWNEKFQMFPENPKKDVLKCVVWDKDFWTFDDKIGSVSIPVIDVLNANGRLHKEFDIIGSKCGAKLVLQLKYKEMY